MKEIDEILDVIEEGFKEEKKKKVESKLKPTFNPYNTYYSGDNIYYTSGNHTHGDYTYINRSTSPEIEYRRKDSIKHICRCKTEIEIIGEKLDRRYDSYEYQQFIPMVDVPLERRSRIYCPKCGMLIEVLGIKIEQVLSNFEQGV